MRREKIGQALKKAETLWPIGLSFAVALVFCTVAFWMLSEMRRDAQHRAEEGATNLVNVIAQDVARNAELIDLSLDAVVDGLGRPDVLALSPEMRQLVLFDRAASAKNLGALVVYDETGELRIDSAGVQPRKIAPATDRDYFQAQKDKDVGLFVSRPYTSRLLGTEVIGFSRRLSREDGSFAGVALGTIQLSYFTDLFRRLNVGRGGVVSLVRTDGMLLAREPAFRGEAWRNVSRSFAFQRMRDRDEARFIERSGVDAVERLYSSRRIAGLPLIVSVGLATDDVFAEWRSKALALAVIVFLVCVASVWLTWILVRQLRRRYAAEQDLLAANTVLSQMSLTDPLTALANRRQFDRLLAAEARRATRTGRALSLIVLDADRFKRFNDRYGHQAGDAVLKTIAQCLTRVLERPSDVACRIGGEEFAVILPETDLAGCVVVADRIRAAILDEHVPHADNETGLVSVSLGSASMRPDEDVTALFMRADAALYEAKRQGRNRAAASEELTATAWRAA